MNLNVSKEWLLKMTEKEDNGIYSVGGLLYGDRHIFRPATEPKETTAEVINKMVTWLKANEPKLEAELDGDDGISFFAVDGDAIRHIQAFLGHLMLKTAEELGHRLEIQ